MSPSISEQAETFDEWNRKYRFGSYRNTGPEIFARAERTLEYLDGLGLQDPQILEIGCGSGWVTAALEGRGSVWACDLSPVAVEHARNCGLAAEFRVGFVLEMDIPSGDVAVVFDTLFYVENQAELVERLADRVDWLILSNINSFVYSRCAEVGPPEPGQYRGWLSIRETT